MDGYFPSELQERYPEGVPFQVCLHLEPDIHKRLVCWWRELLIIVVIFVSQVHDNRHEEFVDRPLFSGKGLAVGAVINPPTSIPGALTAQRTLTF